MTREHFEAPIETSKALMSCYSVTPTNNDKFFLIQPTSKFLFFSTEPLLINTIGNKVTIGNYLFRGVSVPVAAGLYAALMISQRLAKFSNINDDYNAHVLKSEAGLLQEALEAIGCQDLEDDFLSMAGEDVIEKMPNISTYYRVPPFAFYGGVLAFLTLVRLVNALAKVRIIGHKPEVVEALVKPLIITASSYASQALQTHYINDRNEPAKVQPPATTVSVPEPVPADRDLLTPEKSGNGFTGFVDGSDESK